MWEEVLRIAAANGLWALLFVALLIYQLQDSRKREIKYQETIERLTCGLKALDEVRKDVSIIRNNTEIKVYSRERVKKEAI